jgi:hypothetical protein
MPPSRGLAGAGRNGASRGAPTSRAQAGVSNLGRPLLWFRAGSVRNSALASASACRISAKRAFEGIIPPTLPQPPPRAPDVIIPPPGPHESGSHQWGSAPPLPRSHGCAGDRRAAGRPRSGAVEAGRPGGGRSGSRALRNPSRIPAVDAGPRRPHHGTPVSRYGRLRPPRPRASSPRSPTAASPARPRPRDSTSAPSRARSTTRWDGGRTDRSRPTSPAATVWRRRDHARG